MRRMVGTLKNDGENGCKMGSFMVPCQWEPPQSANGPNQENQTWTRKNW